MIHSFIIQTYQQARRFVIIVVGFTVLSIGIVLIVLPGPAILVIPLGLSILATELIWAKQLLHRFKKEVNRVNSPRKARRLLLFAKTKIGQRVSGLFARK